MNFLKKRKIRLGKNLISMLVVSSLVVSFVPVVLASMQTLPVVSTFDELSVGEKPADFKIAGDVYATEQFGEKAFMIKNDNDGDMTSLTSSFDRVKGEAVTVELSMLQKSLRIDGNVY